MVNVCRGTLRETLYMAVRLCGCAVSSEMGYMKASSRSAGFDRSFAAGTRTQADEISISYSKSQTLVATSSDGAKVPKNIGLSTIVHFQKRHSECLSVEIEQSSVYQ